MKIAIFGAQGKFGTSLTKHLQEIKTDSVEFLPTTDKEHNKEIAESCDLAIIVVQPEKVVALFQEIKPFLKLHCQVLSFVAHFPIARLEQLSGRPSARGMADPWWTVSAFVRNMSFLSHGIEFIFDDFTKEKSQFLSNDEEIDTFTGIFSYLFVLLILNEMSSIYNFEKHLNFISSHLKVSPDSLKEVLPYENPRVALDLIQTRGRITERISSLILENPQIEPDELFIAIQQYKF